MADGADAAAAAPAVDPLAPPKAVAAPKGEYTTYSDDAALGKPAPSLDTLEYIKVRDRAGPVTLLGRWRGWTGGWVGVVGEGVARCMHVECWPLTHLPSQLAFPWTCSPAGSPTHSIHVTSSTPHHLLAQLANPRTCSPTGTLAHSIHAMSSPPHSLAKGDPVKLGNGKITVILFWAKFAKGDYTTYAGVADLATLWVGNENVQFLGVSPTCILV